MFILWTCKKECLFFITRKNKFTISLKMAVCVRYGFW